MTKKVKKPLTKKGKIWILVAALSVFLAAAVTAGALLIFGNQNPADPKVKWYSEEETEFVITSADQLYEVAYLSTKYNFEGQTIKLGADIVINEGDAATWGKTPPSRLWYPIENFNGTFDGQGHTISGLYGVAFNDEMGLFANTDKRSKILNLRVVNSYIKNSGEHGTGFISANGGGTFENIYVDGILYSDNWNNGGIIGCVDMSGDTAISNCWFAGEMILVSDQGRVAGGIVGDVMPESGVVSISHCLSTGKFSAVAITNTSRGRLMDIGGIVGRASSGTTNITDCFSNTDIDSGCLEGAGVFIGSSGKGKTILTHNFAIAKDGLKSMGYRYNATTGDIYTYAPERVTGFEAYSWTTLDFENYWAVDEDGTPILKTFADKVPSVKGVKKMVDASWYTKRNTATIKTLEQLRGLHVVSQWDNMSGKTIYLGADIVVNEGDASEWGENAPAEIWNGISSANVMFAGTFDGLGHSISGLYKKEAANGLGLFVATTDGATIRNLSVLNSYFETNNVAVNNQTYSYIGSVAAYARGTTFDTIYSDAIMVSDGYYCGGIVGLMRNGKANTVTNCWYDGKITLLGENTGMRGGGIVGSVWNVALNMSHCLNTSEVTGESWGWGANEGLMVAYPQTKAVVTIEDSLCAARFLVLDGKKDGNGMIVGRISADATVTMSNVFAIKTPDPKPDPNAEKQWLCNWGLTGYRAAEPEFAGPALILDKSYLTGTNAYRYTSLDFKNFWALDKEGHPKLQAFMAEDEEMIDYTKYSKAVDFSWYTSKKDLYISTRAQLNALSLLAYGDSFKDKTVHLANSISLNSGNAEDWDTYAPANKWIPIGSADNMFQGTFDGHGYTISGLYVSEPNNGLGLFGMVKNATIKNLRLTNSFVESTMCATTKAKGEYTNYNYIGGIAAYAAKSTFSGIYTNVIVKNDGDYTGGILGMANTKDNPVTISNCWFDGTIIQDCSVPKKDGSLGPIYAGGIVGLLRNTGATISHTLSTGTMSQINMPEGTWGSVTGGMIGRIDQTGTNPGGTVVITDSLANITWNMPVSTQGGNGNVISQANPATFLKLENVYAVSNGWKGVATNRCSEKGGGSEGEVGMVAATNITGAKAYINANLDYNNYWTALEGKTPQLKRFASGTVAEKLVIDTSWYDETQTEIVINTADELIGFASLSKTETFEGKTIKLGADIVLNEGDASTWGETAPSKFWISIGSAANCFKGTFDGQGHTISGIYYQNEGGDGTAMFECIDGATIKNFKLVNSYFDDSKETDGTQAWSRVAAIVGTAFSGTVSDIYTDAYVSGGSMFNAGIVGMFRAPGTTPATLTISNCWFDGKLDLGATGRSSGGILGGVVEGNNAATVCNIENCLMTGVIEGQFVGVVDLNAYNKMPCIGGVVGTFLNCKLNLKDIVVAGEMNVADEATYVGAVYGMKNWGVSSASVADGVYVISDVYGANYYVNPENGHNNMDAWTGVSRVAREDMLGGMARNTAAGLDFSETGAWIAVADKLPELRYFSDAEDAPVVADPRAETTEWFDGTKTEYTINTLGEMKGFITLSQTNTFDGITIKLNTDIKWNDGDAAEWSTAAPNNVLKFIGTASNPFKGTFDGQDHTISGAYYKSTTGGIYTGMFAEVENATIKNLIIENSAMHTTSGSGGNGILVGRAKGVTVENVKVGSNVYATNSTHGGMVSYAEGANAVTFKNVWMAGNVTNGMWAARIGGLLGCCSNTSGLVITVENCLFTGTVAQTHATTNYENYVGGLVGGTGASVKLLVKNSLSAGTVTKAAVTNIYTGSVAGITSWNGAAYTTFENVYATEECYNVGTYRQPSEYTGTIVLVEEEDILGGLARWTLPNLDFSETGAWIAVEDAIPELRYFSDAEDAPAVDNPADGPVVLDEIIVTAPTKTTYDVGETLDTNGMVVKAVYTDNSEEELTDADYTITGFDSSAVGTVTVTITYQGMTATFEVNIVEIPDDPNEETTYWYDGTLTEYTISTVGEMKGFVTLSKTNTFSGVTIKLGADIVWNEGDAADWATTAPANVWTPIGDQDNGFLGIFDGQGHTVSGLYCVDTTYASFVARLYNGGTVKNVSVVNSYFRSNGNTKNYSGAGIVARLQNASVSGIYTNAIFEAVWDAGIVATVPGSKATITNCWFDGTVVAANRAGGMLGYAHTAETFTFTNCLFTGSISGNDSTGYYGGLVGIGNWNTTFNVTNCLVAGDMSGVTAGVVGAVVGQNPGDDRSIYTNVYATTETHANLKGGGGATFPVVAVAKANILGDAAKTALSGLDFVNTWTTVENDVPVLKIFAESGDGEGDEPAVDPNEETTAWFDNSKTEFTLKTFGEFKGFVTLALTNNFAGKTIKLDTDISYGDGVWSAANATWKPIGTKDLPFAGTFDGLGHTISGLLTKKDAGGYHGLFGVISGATIKNLRIENCTFHPQSRATYFVGSVAAYATNSTISNIYSNAILYAAEWIGGMVAHAEGTIDVDNCWFDGSIRTWNSSTTAVQRHGGIVGRITTDGSTVDNCLFTGTVEGAYGRVSADSDSYLGGIVGMINYNKSVRIANCLSAGSFAAVSPAEGMQIGSVLGCGSAKPITGGNNFATAECYSAMITNRPENLTGMATQIAQATILGDAAKTVMTGFDFENIWTTVEGKTPALRLIVEEEEDEIVTDPNALDTSWYNASATTFTLTTAGQLKGLVELSKTNNFAGKTILLGDDITLNEGNAADWATTAPENNWGVIGDVDTHFEGTFDGQGHTISGLYCAFAGGNSMGMFREVKGTVTNFKLINAYLVNTVDDGYGYNGVIASFLNGGTISKVYTDAIFMPVDSYAGGIVGFTGGATATISECQFNGILKARCSMDGTCGATGGQSRAHANYVGGIVGAATANNTNVSDCIFSGRIMNQCGGSHRTAGIIGGVDALNKNVTIQRCFSVGMMGTFAHDNNSYHFSMLMDCRGLNGNITLPTNNATLYSDNYILRVAAYKEDGTTPINAGGAIDGCNGGSGTATKYTEAEMIAKIAADYAASNSNLDFENVWTYNEGALPTLTAFAD